MNMVMLNISCVTFVPFIDQLYFTALHRSIASRMHFQRCFHL